jgi:hypothetical protein
VATLAENENDTIAFKAFQGILKIVKEGRCPILNAIDDGLGNAPYAIKDRSMHKNYIEETPMCPTVLYDLIARFINAIAPRLHILIARGRSLPLSAQYVVIEAISYILRFLLDMGVRIRTDEPSRYESPIAWSISFIQTIVLPLLNINKTNMPSIVLASSNAIWTICCSKLMKSKRFEWYPQVAHNLFNMVLQKNPNFPYQFIRHCNANDERKTQNSLRLVSKPTIYTNGFPFQHGEMIERVIGSIAYIPKSEWHAVLPLTIRIIGSVVHVKKRLVMLQYIFDLMLHEQHIDLNGKTPNLLERCFKQNEWLHHLVYSPCVEDANQINIDSASTPLYSTATPFYFREEVILSIFLSWVKCFNTNYSKTNSNAGVRHSKKKNESEKLIPVAFALLEQFYICFSYFNHRNNKQRTARDQHIHEYLRTALICHVYLDVFEICLKHIVTTNMNNQDYESTIYMFYNNFLTMVLLESEETEEEEEEALINKYSSKTNRVQHVEHHKNVSLLECLRLNVNIHGLILIIKYINVFIDYNDVYDNDIVGETNKGKRVKLETAIIHILNIYVNVTNSSSSSSSSSSNNNSHHVRSNNRSDSGSDKHYGNNAGDTMGKCFATDHLLSSMYIFIPALLTFMKAVLLKSRTSRQTIGMPLGSPLHDNMMGNVTMIENITDWIHKVIYRLEESNQIVSNTSGDANNRSNFIVNKGTLPSHILSEMLKTLINSTSTILLGATVKPSEDTNDIIGIIRKNVDGVKISNSNNNNNTDGAKYPIVVGAGVFYDQIAECTYDLKLTPQDTDDTNRNMLKYLIHLHDHIQSPYCLSNGIDNNLTFRNCCIKQMETDEEILEDIIMKNPMVKRDDLIKASWISSPRSLFLSRSSFYNKQMYDEINPILPRLNVDEDVDYKDLNGSSDPLMVSMKHQYFHLSKRLVISVRIMSMMNFPCYGPVHVRLALSNTSVLTVSPTGIQHTFEGTLLPRTTLQWDTVFYVESFDDVSVTPLVKIAYIKTCDPTSNNNANGDSTEGNGGKYGSANNEETTIEEEYYDDSELEENTDNEGDDVPQQYIVLKCEKYYVTKCNFITRGPNWVKNATESFTSLWIRLNNIFFSYGEAHVHSERTNTPEEVLALLACCSRKYFRYLGVIPTGRNMTGGGFIGTTCENHWLLFTVTIVKDISFDDANSNNAISSSSSSNNINNANNTNHVAIGSNSSFNNTNISPVQMEMLNKTFSLPHLEYINNTRIFNDNDNKDQSKSNKHQRSSGEGINVWKAQFEFRSDSSHVLNRIKGKHAFSNDNYGGSFSTFIDIISNGLFQVSLQNSNHENTIATTEDEIFSSLSKNKHELVYEVDRVNKVTKHFEPENSSSSSSNSHHHSMHQNNALFRSEMLDHTIEEEGNAEDSMDNLLFVVNEFRR